MVAFAVSTTPWSNDGVKVDKIDTMREAMENAKLDFAVETSPAMHRTRHLSVDELIRQHGFPEDTEDLQAFCNAATTQQFELAESHNVIRREDNHSVFGICKDRWEPLQNVDAFDWFQPALDAGLVKLDTVGTLGGGKKVWILAELDKPPSIIVPGEEIAKYIILGNGHDGKTSIFIGFTPIRVWCANMFPQLRKDKSSKLIRLTHSKNAKLKLDALRDVMNFAYAEFEATAEQYRNLCNHSFNTKDLEKYVKILFCNKEEIEKELKDLSTRRRNVLNRVMDLVETGMGLQQPKIRNTWFAAFNAVNQYVNYETCRNSNNRLNSLWFGTNQDLNKRALELAIEMAA